MKINNNNYLISPSDLNNFIACKYTTINEIKFHKGEVRKNKEATDSKLWKKMGLKHEVKHFNILSKKYKKNISIPQDIKEKERFNLTIEAMKNGYDLIYHAFLIDENFRGESDFLIKTNEIKSDIFGDYSYEVYDTKISRNLRPSHINQIMAYSFMISKIQKKLPKKMYLIDGNDYEHEFKTSEYLDIFNHSKSEFTKYLSKIEKEKIYPEKCSFCKFCDWQDECEKIWEKDNYINLVAGTNKSQIEKLKKNGIKTIEQLSKTQLLPIKLKINTETFKRIKSQSELQEEKRLTGKSKILVLKPEYGYGFYKLPKPDEGDIFFDIEGFPNMDRPFEYLFGLYLKNKEKYKFKYFWAKDFNKQSEEEIFKELINLFEKHFVKYPNAHIYHYAPYEKRAIRELASAHSTNFPKGDMINDDLLRNEKYVDLYSIVSQSIRTSEKDLSLKSIEQFYDFKRKADITKADISVEMYDNWLATKNDKYKQDIISYNEEDCISTFLLREYLIKNKPQNIDWFEKKVEEKKDDQFSKKYKKKDTTKKSREDINIDLIKKLEKIKNKTNKDFVENLQNLVGFHWRDNKPDLWEVYDRVDKTHIELEDDTECIANCVLQSNKPKEIKEGYLFKFKFPDQNYKLKKNSTAFDVHTKKDVGKVHLIHENLDNNILEIFCPKKKDRRGNLYPPPQLDSLITFGKGYPPKTPQHADALNKFVTDYIDENGKNYKAIMDMLSRSNPDIINLKSGLNLINQNEDIVSQSIKIAKNLNKTYLTIQGPPGTGKTFTSAKIIIELIKEGKKIAVTSNSHEAIKTLLIAIENEAINQNINFKGVRKVSSKASEREWNFIVDKKTGREINLDDYQLYAGTSWFIVDPRFNKVFDYLFIDEAGQVALATTISMATSSKNLVLIGDQMQLSQPIRAKHEGYARKSSLDFILAENDTISPEKGIFLNVTRRLNDKICDYISTSFYDSRLTSDKITKTRSVKLNLEPIKNEGIFYVPIDHTGCSQRSDEEADLVEKIFNKIINKEFKVGEKKGKIYTNDIMVIAPYNAQANNIRERLKKKFDNDVRVGTIDLFQGQEAKVVLISMTTSDVESLPRHKDFFFSRNRLNVAISRAENVAIIIFNQKLLLASANSIEEMRLMNNFCKLIKFKTNYK